jgi:pilus assembly protein CpaB
MNSRRRRGLVFLIISIVVAGATFLAVTAYVANINAQVGDRVTVYQANAEIAPYVPLSADNLVAVQMPRRWASESAIMALDAVSGRRTSFKLSKGTTVTSDMLIPVSSLSSTEREVAINVNSVTGVAGRVSPGDRVDVYAVFGDVPGLAKMAKVLVRNVRVVSVAGEQTVTTDSGSGLAEQKVVPVTLALEASDALAVTYASAFAKEVRMVALPNDVGINRAGERNQYDARDLGGAAVPEGER